ncbi:MAG: hypothetical protein ABJF04_19415 [Reichenbachiella sp.]|uniref:hypothetical protein n=1 Tax=Reichenbachiella sp. TaxID=2184521 RepID=UPI0032636B27
MSILCSESSASPITVNAQDTVRSSVVMSNDFDFLIGKWKITNKILRQRLSGNNEWSEWVAYSHCWKILDGFGNMDEFEMKSREGRIFKGNTIRTYSPSRKEWTLYWVDSWNPDLGITEQTKGSFKDGVGLFYGQEEFNGKTVKLRFTWKSLDENRAYWDQAYYDEENGKWEINWIMSFDRINE